VACILLTEALPCTVQDKDRPLSELQRDRFEDLLRGLSAERRDIRTAMVFALDNAECAAEVVEIVTDALTLKETPIPTKVRSRDARQGQVIMQRGNRRQHSCP